MYEQSIMKLSSRARVACAAIHFEQFCLSRSLEISYLHEAVEWLIDFACIRNEGSSFTRWREKQPRLIDVGLGYSVDEVESGIAFAISDPRLRRSFFYINESVVEVLFTSLEGRPSEEQSRLFLSRSLEEMSKYGCSVVLDPPMPVPWIDSGWGVPLVRTQVQTWITNLRIKQEGQRFA